MSRLSFCVALPEPTPQTPKGEFGGRCNRTACQKQGATWYNRVMQRYYCHQCAFEINEVARGDGMEPFCTPGRPDESEATTA